MMTLLRRDRHLSACREHHDRGDAWAGQPFHGAGAVLPPRHQYFDHDSGLTEIYLRFVLSIQRLMTRRSRYDAAAFGDVGPAVDVWAWGCVVLQCLTNAEPWAVSDIIPPGLYGGASHSCAQTPTGDQTSLQTSTRTYRP
jgi:hypothetical protein